MKQQPRLYTDRVATPIGTLVLIVDAEGRLCVSGFSESHGRMDRELARFANKTRFTLTQAKNPAGISQALEAYFGGDLSALDALETAAKGTPFQERVWRALREIPSGETRSYGDIADRIGNPLAVRAVGLANGANPVCLVVPCHRVIGADGRLTGYGAGIERKRWLLEHEGCMTPTLLR